MSKLTLGAEGYLLSEGGAKLGRLGEPGKVFLWDKRKKSPVTVTIQELLQLWVEAAVRKERGEP